MSMNDFLIYELLYAHHSLTLGISLLYICMYINTFTADTLRNFRSTVGCIKKELNKFEIALNVMKRLKV